MLRTERDGDVAVWTIARPQARNALDYATCERLIAAIAEAANDGSLRAVVLTGEGTTFASGGDLRELRAATTPEQAARLSDVGRSMCDGIARLPVPVIAALAGAAIGGGAELAMACDLRVADPRATMCFKHARMAVTTAWGVLPKLVATVGHAAASRLLLAGHEVDAREALRLGLLDAVTDAGGCVAQALAWARDVAQNAAGAVAELKRLLCHALTHDAAHLLALERDRFVATWTSDDHREAVEAFFESRAPEWQRR